MRIDLVFPGITNSGFGSFGVSADLEANFMHHGLASISAYLKSKGHEVSLIDLRRLSGWEHFESEVGQSNAAAFAISSMSCDYEVSRKAAAMIKRLKPSAVVVIGGLHPTVATDDVLSDRNFDYVITREGEYTLAMLLERLERGDTPERLQHGESVDVATLPWVDRDIFEYERGELQKPFKPHMEPPFVSIITSRGCPFRCKFCQPAERMIFGNKVKIRPVDDVMAELVHLRERYGFKSFLIHDDLFILSPGYVEEFVSKYKENGFTQNFTCQARADIIVRYEERIKLLAEAGCDCFSIGFESGSQKMLDFMDKGTTVEQNREAVEICRRYGIKIYANIMFGLPTETKRDMDATVEFVKWMKADYLSLSTFTPYPGSYLYDYCKERGLLLENEGYRRNPLSGKKVKGVKYWLVGYEIFRCSPKTVIYALVVKLFGARIADLISRVKRAVMPAQSRPKA